MAEQIKTKFEWDDLVAPDLVWPCDHCGALGKWPVCDDGATSSACNHCAFAIISYLCAHDTD
jgi:hypothetical protein